MLTLDQARDIAARWRSQFADAEAYTTSVERYLERIAAPARSPEGLERWLREDAEQEDVRGALLEHVHATGENLPQDLPDIVDDCTVCRGKRLVRRDLPVGHAEFGKLLVCPSCNGRPTGRTLPPLETEPNRCWKCGQSQAELAGEACTNPRWHDPNERLPAQSAVPGWSRLGEHLS